MANKTYKYNELYIASTEKSALTGNAGFGVRAATQGMSFSDAQEIANFFSEGYRVPSEMALTYDKIVANPEVIYDYTPTFVVRSVTLSNGRTVHVVGRTVYIGIDYGFFTDNEGAQRAGANYFTHLFIFDQKPSQSVIEALCDGCRFMPNNYVLRKDNPELRALLTGEPPVLPAGKSIEVADGSDNPEPFMPEMANVITGLLQLHTNIVNGKTDGLAKMMVKAHNDIVPPMLYEMGRLPQALTKDLAIVTNYMDQGMPLDFNLVFVNEYNTRDMYEEYNICADTRNDNNHNIDKNLIIEKIKEFVTAQDKTNAERLINYYLSLDPTKGHDYDFLYKIFVAVDSDLPLELDDITEEFIEGITKANLDPLKMRKIWDKINASINAGLQSGNTGRAEGIVKAIRVAGYVNSSNPSKLSIEQESKNQITSLLFGYNTYFDKLITTSNCDLLMRMVDMSYIENASLVFAALHKTCSQDVWGKVIRAYFGPELDKNFAFVLDNITTSPLRDDEKPELMVNLYPVGRYENDYYSYILDRPLSISTLGKIVIEVCLNRKEDVFVDIISRSNSNRSVIQSLAPSFEAYFMRKLDAKSDATMRRVMALINQIGPDDAVLIGADRIVRNYVESIYKVPPRECNAILDSIIASGIKLDNETAAMLNRSKHLLDQRVPDSVKIDFIISAYRMNSSQNYIVSLFKKWLRDSRPTKDDVKTLLSNCPRISSTMIESFITTVWESPELKSKEELVLAIVDNSQWSNKKDFVKQCKDKTLVAFLTENDKFFTKLFRKMFK